jgi:hypothetical protein
MRADVSAWLASAVADAKRRGLPELEPLLVTLARSLQSLREADREFAHPGLAVDSDSPHPDDAAR